MPYLYLMLTYQLFALWQRWLHGLVWVVALGLGFSASAEPGADYVVFQEARLRNGISALEEERLQVRVRFAAMELQCLQKFVSSACLEDVRQEYTRALRELDLVQEMLNIEIRQLHSAARQRARQQNIARHVQSLEMRNGKGLQ